MRRPLVHHLAILFALAAPAFAGRLSGQEPADSVGPYGVDTVVARVLTGFVAHERAEKGIPAISIALVRGHQVVWARGFGWADSAAAKAATATTVYRVGSVSKLFTDVGIMRLVERGSVDLDAPVERYIPDFHPTNPFGGRITVRELTSHRAGLTREPPVGNYFDDSGPSLTATVASLNQTALVYKPGTHAKYSNAGIAVLGDVLERTQHESFYPYLERAVLQPMGLDQSAFRPRPDLLPRMAKGTMWTFDGRRFDAPTFQLGMGPCGSMYTTVLDLGRFLEMLFARGVAPNGTRVLAARTLDTMWTPQFAAPGAKTGFGIGFDIERLDGHLTVGHDGAIYGFATTLRALPDDSIGVVVVATLDGANTVTDRIGDAALRMMLDVREGKAPTAPDTTTPLPRARALALAGHYTGAHRVADLTEYEGHLYLSPLGVARGELRVPAHPGRGEELIVDDVLSYGPRVVILGDGRIVVASDTLRRAASTVPPPAATAYASLIGEYGWDHDVLYVHEQGGRLHALIEWFFDYPLERVSRDVYRFPAYGLYDGQEIVFRRGADGRATVATAATVPFPRRPLPVDDDRINARIAPVRAIADLRQAALAATPPAESGRSARVDLMELRGLDSTIHYDIRYATANNFMGTPFYTSAHAFMQRPAAQAVARVSATLRAQGLGLVIHDAYRPWYVTKMFWDGTPVDKHVFVADPTQGSRHNRGCAVDLTLYELASGRPIRMTGGYDEMTDRSYPLYPGGTSRQRYYRDLLRHAMEAEGFTVYEAEWWHFDYGDWRQYPIGNVTFETLTAQTSSGAATPPPSRQP
jgi:CubicO group peptidase (beta-lactamase class C family)/D-alanyl-D-alanine dipeptidase